jgi:hypothetical protein
MSYTVKICPKCGMEYSYISVEQRRTGKRTSHELAIPAPHPWAVELIERGL